MKQYCGCNASGIKTFSSFSVDINENGVFVMIWLKGFRPMQNSSGDSESPWYMLYLMLIWAIGFKLASRVVFQIPIEFLMKALVLSIF